MNVAVVLGGTNEERNVSLATGRAVVGALRERGHQVVAVDPAHGAVPPEEEARMLGGAVGADPPGIEELARLGASAVGAALADLPAVRKADVVFLALHGEFGEDGTVQGLLDLAGVAYTGSGCLGSAVAFDKRVSKELLAHMGVPTPAWTAAHDSAAEIVAALDLPLVVKPASGGSTVGLSVVRSKDELQPAIELAARYDDDVLCEAFIAGRELTVAVLEGVALPPVEIIPSHEIYDYECKYSEGMSRYVAPADLSAAETERLQDLAMRSYLALRQTSYSRVDFRRAEDGSFWCLEANSLPGLTSTSLVPKAAKAAGIGFPELCERIARAAMDRAGQGSGRT
ncbi:MAG: D-alanine--D-alanine ligase [Gemmatimonadetes bacterium]|nr:D-alanine--D-alanine ligase [Gemmatimonadota bacterium]